MKHSVIGMGIAKRAFQLHSVDPATGEVERIKLRRDEVLPFFAQRSASLVAMEACGSAHWWARQLRALGHEVRLLAPKSVRPFVRSNKTDAADARAIWTAVQQPEARLVAVKSTKISGGKVLAARTRRSTNRVRQALKLAAMSLSRNNSALGAFYRRLCSRMDKPRANTAVAHKLARMIYLMLTRGEAYVDRGQ